MIAFEAVAPDKNLASPDIFANRTLSDDINFQMTNMLMLSLLFKELKLMNPSLSAFEVLRKRIDQVWCNSVQIFKDLGNSGRILE